MKNIKKEFELYATKHQRISTSLVKQYMNCTSMSMTPYITEERQLNVSQMDVFSRLMVDRIIFLGQAVDDQVANILQAQLLFLQSVDTKQDISLYINSPGGIVYAGLGIYDTMQYIGPDVATICTGTALSMASVLLCAGAKGKRSALKHARIMVHQASGGTQGTAADMEISLKETLKVQKELYDIIAHHSGQSYDTINEAAQRDFWMTAEEAKSFGMIDDVLQ
ncbi:ATP-dependent Clp protease proteolytic subunit [Olivibacter sitiensis]|uniref:ATP-dependent Clp protease proteolytic subunit n=1 Tax=Olivibacter sitiensis TaxID=376470 RepID=UPI0004158EF6|nr:ATP-dependent Clp protease proteolytic subunit [Olivibacter sitiensis]